MNEQNYDRLMEVVLDYIKTYGLSKLARNYFVTSQTPKPSEAKTEELRHAFIRAPHER